MKKLYTIILLSALSFTHKAQLTLNQGNHAPAAADTYTMYRCDSVNVSPGASGNNANWNFTGITTFSTLIRNYVAAAVTSTTYPQANVGVASAANDNAYYKSSPGSLDYFGGNVAFATIVGSLTYTSPLIQASYPMNFNSIVNSTVGGTMAITSPAAATGTFTGNAEVKVDGSGTISLPGDTYTNAIRVITSQTLNISSLLPVTVVQVNYSYYAQGIKTPVFSISTSTATTLGSPSTQTVVMRLKPGSVTTPTGTSVKELLSEETKILVFPNPATNVVNFFTSYNDADFVLVYDLTGREVAKLTFSDSKAKLDVSKYTRGLYMYKVVGSNNRTLTSGKITVTD